MLALLEVRLHRRYEDLTLRSLCIPVGGQRGVGTAGQADRLDEASYHDGLDVADLGYIHLTAALLEHHLHNPLQLRSAKHVLRQLSLPLAMAAALKGKLSCLTLALRKLLLAAALELGNGVGRLVHVRIGVIGACCPLLLGLGRDALPQLRG